MTLSLHVTPVTHPQEAQQLGEILSQCFNFTNGTSIEIPSD
ncbi:hypothetical protein [Planktothrix sp. FACHB-1365]|nr:hypothetical protein [Planktothrix sp. FACHB-1365]